MLLDLRLSHCLFLGVIIIFLLQPIFQAPPHFVDEWEYIEVPDQNVSALEFTLSYIKKGRFKPVGCIIQWSISKIANGNFTILRIWVSTLTISCIILFYLLLLRVQSKSWSAFLLSILLLTGPFNEIWWRLGPYESIALLILLIAAHVSLNKKQSSFLLIILYLSMGMTKETFLPCILFVPFVRWKGQNIILFLKENRIDFIIAVCCFLFLFICLIVLNSNSQVYLQDSSFNRFELLTHNLRGFFSPVPVLIAIVVSMVLNYRLLNKRLMILAMAAIVLWIGLQAVLHQNVLVQVQSRYLMPATLCFYIFLHLTNQRAKSVNVLLLLLCLVGLKNNYSYIDHYSARSKVYWDVLGLIKESDNRKVVLLMEPFQGREIVHATQLYLGNQFEVLECNIKNAETDKDTREVRKYYASLTTYKNAKIYDWHTFEDSLVDKSSSIMVGHPNEFSLLTKDLNQMTKIKEQRISRNYFELSLQNLIHGEFKYTNSVSRSVYSY